MGLRKLCLALTFATSSGVSPMKRPPAFMIAVKPGQPMPPPHSAATRPSATITGPSPAFSR